MKKYKVHIRKTYNIVLLTVLTGFIIACEEDNSLPTVGTSLKIVHAATGTPSVLVNYFNHNIAYADIASLEFSESMRVTLPPNATREVIIVPTEDTLTQVLNREVNLQSGGIFTMFLLTEGQELEGLLIEDVLLNSKDSLVGVRFANFSSDIGLVTVNISGETENLVNGLAFRDVSNLSSLSATSEEGSYQFEFKDEEGNIVGIAKLNPFSGRPRPIYKSLTYAIIGQSYDGVGNSTLEVIRIDSF